MKTINDYRNKKVLVLGAGKSGTHAAELLKELGATVVLSDSKPSSELPEIEELADAGIQTITGKQDPAILDDGFDIMIKIRVFHTTTRWWPQQLTIICRSSPRLNWRLR